MALPRPHPAFKYFSDFLARGEGIGALALATDDAIGAHAINVLGSVIFTNSGSITATDADYSAIEAVVGDS